MTDTVARESGDLEAAVIANPRLSRWVTFRDGQVVVRCGKVELGQGILTALAIVAAENLGVDPARIVMQPVHTDCSPDEGTTSGSFSMERSGAALRQVCRVVRHLFARCAADRLGVHVDGVTVRDGQFTCDGSTEAPSYWSLAMIVSTDIDVDPDLLGAALSGDVPPIRDDLPRIDLRDKVLGVPRFIQDLNLPGMRHGRVVRPPGPGARLLALADDVERQVIRCRGELIRDASFLGVVSDDEFAATRAAEALSAGARWSPSRMLPDSRDLATALWSAPATMVPGPTLHSDLQETPSIQITTEFYRPYLAHASIGTSCAVARWDRPDRLAVWSHSQGCFGLRRDLARVFELDDRNVTVEHVEGAGAYGANPADDVALDAALLARHQIGVPVRVLLSRRDELTWDPFGPAMAVRIQAGASAGGRVVTWSHEIRGSGHSSRPGTFDVPALLSAELIDGGVPIPPAQDPAIERGGGNLRNAAPYYDFGAYRVTSYTLDEPPIRTSALRALGAGLNVFAIESTVDELAELCGVSPLDIRLHQLSDPRARKVLATAARMSDWGRRRAEGTGLGIGFARYKNKSGYCAVVAEVTALDGVAVTDLYIAADVGRAVSLDGLRNQVEGGAVQATSWALKEEVTVRPEGILSEDWETYPILRFTEVPVLHVEVIDRPTEPILGAGEIAQGPTIAAIGNAIADATGVRIRRLPFTRDNIIATIDQL